MFCEQCGKPVEDTDVFCSYCGARVGKEVVKENLNLTQPESYSNQLQSDDISASHIKPKSNAAKIGIIIGSSVGAIIVVALVVTLVVVSMEAKKGTENEIVTSNSVEFKGIISETLDESDKEDGLTEPGNISSPNQSQLDILKKFLLQPPEEAGYSLSIEDYNNNANYKVMTLLVTKSKVPVCFVSTDEPVSHAGGYGYFCYLDNGKVRLENYDQCYVTKSGMVILGGYGGGRLLRFFAPSNKDDEITFDEVGVQEIIDDGMYGSELTYNHWIDGNYCSEQEFLSKITSIFGTDQYIEIGSAMVDNNIYTITPENLDKKMTVEYVESYTQEVFNNTLISLENIMAY